SNEWKTLKNSNENNFQNKISEYLTTPIYAHGYMQTIKITQAQSLISLPINSASNSSNIPEEIPEEVLYNAAVQKRIIELIQNANKKLDKKKKMVITTNAELKAQFASQINNIQTEINNKKDQLNKLKYAFSQRKSYAKKLKQLNEENE
ncbi:2262_t:CDS:1, partial [Gigaspora rosea]